MLAKVGTGLAAAQKAYEKSAVEIPCSLVNVNPELCLARLGRPRAGEQCVRPRRPGAEFCGQHLKTWETLGRVDWPLPNDKLGKCRGAATARDGRLKRQSQSSTGKPRPREEEPRRAPQRQRQQRTSGELPKSRQKAFKESAVQIHCCQSAKAARDGRLKRQPQSLTPSDVSVPPPPPAKVRRLSDVSVPPPPPVKVHRISDVSIHTPTAQRKSTELDEKDTSPLTPPRAPRLRVEELAGTPPMTRWMRLAAASVEAEDAEKATAA